VVARLSGPIININKLRHQLSNSSDQVDRLGDKLNDIEPCIDIAILAAEVDWVAPLSESPKGERPAYLTEATFVLWS